MISAGRASAAGTRARPIPTKAFRCHARSDRRRNTDASASRVGLARRTPALSLRIGALRDPSCAGHRTAHRCVLRGAVRRASPARCEQVITLITLITLMHVVCCAGLCMRLPQHDHAVADCVGPGLLTPSTSVPGLGSPRHVCTWTGLALPHPCQGWAHPCHTCTGTCLRVQAFADLPFAFVQMSSWCATRTAEPDNSQHAPCDVHHPTWRRSVGAQHATESAASQTAGQPTETYRYLSACAQVRQLGLRQPAVHRVLVRRASRPPLAAVVWR